MNKNLLTALLALLTLGLTACATDVTNDYLAKKKSNQGSQSYAYGKTGQVSQTAAKTNRELRQQRVVYFGFDKTQVNAADLAVINAHAQFLKTHPQQRIVLEGHTDERGSSEYNIGLGERRDKAIANLLKAKGVRPGQIRLVSFGKEKPAVLGHTESAFSKNRRVEIRYEQS